MVSPVVRLGSTQHERDPMAGLSERDAIANLDRDGYNELPSAQSRGILSIAWESIQDPIFLRKGYANEFLRMRSSYLAPIFQLMNHY